MVNLNILSFNNNNSIDDIIHTREEINSMEYPEHLIEYNIPNNYYHNNSILFFNLNRHNINISNNIYNVIQPFFVNEEINNILIIDNEDVEYAYEHFKLNSYYFEELNINININCYHTLEELEELRNIINRDYQILSDNYNPLLESNGFDAMFYKGIKFI